MSKDKNVELIWACQQFEIHVMQDSVIQTTSVPTCTDALTYRILKYPLTPTL